MSEYQGDWTDEDDADVEYESMPEWHPSLFVDVFRTGLETSQDPALLTGAFVTPESAGYWGDFTRARSVFGTGLRISMQASSTSRWSSPSSSHSRTIGARVLGAME